jgi:hypothetical protein
MDGKPEAWVRKEKKHQNQQLQRALDKTKYVASTKILTVRTFDILDLLGGHDDKIDPKKTAHWFLLSFKGQVKIRKVRDILLDAFQKVDIEELR